MSPRQRQFFHVAMIVATTMTGLCAARSHAEAQAIRATAPGSTNTQQPATSSAPASSKASAGISATPQANTELPAHTAAARSMLDEPAAPAQIQVAGDLLSIHATNASLSDVIRQVAIQTGMQVEGNSHDQRVFGSYGPGSPQEVLSALLYDSGYNVVMVGSTADGAPRRLVLSARTSSIASSGAAAPARNADDDDAETPEDAPPQQPSPIVQPPGANVPPPAPGQPKTPQQMLEELQRMHQGQAAPEPPRE